MSTKRWRAYAMVLAAGAAVSMLAVAGAAAQPTNPAARAAPAAAVAGNDELPIRKITLYRSGVGYFERAGTVRPDGEVQLRFNTEQINDILKSMVVVLDPKVGRLDSISYGSKEPLARRLASFGVNISDNPGVPELLNRLRGAPIKVVAAGDQITGTILGVESRKVPAARDQGAYDAPHLNLVTQTGLKSIAVSDISSFELLDKELADELNKALASLAEYRADRSKTVNMRFGGASGGALPVTVAYVHEMPVWKTSYRLVLPDSGARINGLAKPPQLTIQGWAIVENTTDHDWNDVRLALVSGRPISFQMDLYEPLYVFRPEVPVPTIPGVAPRAYAGGVERGLVETLEEARRKGEEQFAGAPVLKSTGGLEAAAAYRYADKDMERAHAATEMPAISMQNLTEYSAAAQAQGGEIGEVFQYELEAPVTVERQRSAMIPILNSTISGRRVSIFNLADGAEHPMRGVELTNDSGLQLLPGPISVIDGADGKTIYAGDSQVGHIGQGDKRLLAYAVDLDVGVLTEQTGTSTVTRLRIVDGLLEQTVKSLSRTAYAFDNNDERRARTIIVEQTRQSGWELVEPKKAAEMTQELYRFEVEVAPDKTAALAVQQERVEYQRVQVLSIDRPTLLEYFKQGRVSDAVVKAIAEAAAKQAAIGQAERSVAEIDRQAAEIAQDQGRIRENMARIDRNSQLYAKYMTKLTDQETQLEDLHTRRVKAQEQVEKLKAELASYIKGLNVE